MEQVWGIALGNRSKFEEQLCAATSQSSFEESQLWGAALEINFRMNFWGQYSIVILQSSFWEPLWRIALGNRFEV